MAGLVLLLGDHEGGVGELELGELQLVLELLRPGHRLLLERPVLQHVGDALEEAEERLVLEPLEVGRLRLVEQRERCRVLARGGRALLLALRQLEVHTLHFVGCVAPVLELPELPRERRCRRVNELLHPRLHEAGRPLDQLHPGLMLVHRRRVDRDPERVQLGGECHDPILCSLCRSFEI